MGQTARLQKRHFRPLRFYIDIYSMTHDAGLAKPGKRARDGFRGLDRAPIPSRGDLCLVVTLSPQNGDRREIARASRAAAQKW
ncbi:hypothetical protein MPC4_160058 [Methylocella tundrae]|uniref:Uncharacterized protein n=1 Tax=Methylocella tundrae TaxID=227605 RepID=A0A8B6M3L1_METTU|nr:hypothetical protein MPC1_3920003 [Methylocella tundrae]VTZ49408.1 hypothetical protein MPC4_160058 [Methylocella tundrae]